MAGTKRTRTGLATEDQDTYLPDNTSQAIDPAEHRQSNEDINASCPNFLDDNMLADATENALGYENDPNSDTWDQSDATYDLFFVPFKLVPFPNIYANVYFFDPQITDLGVGEIGNINKPFQNFTDVATSGETIEDGSYLVVLNSGSLGTFTADNCILNANGFNVSVGVSGVTASTIYNSKSMTLAVASNAQVVCYNCEINTISQATGSGSLFLYGCRVLSDMTTPNLIEADNCTFEGIAITRAANEIKITGCHFKSSLTINDRCGGSVLGCNFTSDSTTLAPISWSAGFNTSQSGGAISLIGNNFDTDYSYVVDEIIDSNTSQMEMRAANNYYKTGSFSNLTSNTLIANLDNKLIV